MTNWLYTALPQARQHERSPDRNPAAAARSRTSATTSGALNTVTAPDSAGMTRSTSTSTSAGAGARRGWRSGVVLDRARVVHRVRSGGSSRRFPSRDRERPAWRRSPSGPFLDAVAPTANSMDQSRPTSGEPTPAPHSPVRLPLGLDHGGWHLWDSAYHGHMIATGPQRHSRHGQGAAPQDPSRRSAA